MEGTLQIETYRKAMLEQIQGEVGRPALEELEDLAG